MLARRASSQAWSAPRRGTTLWGIAVPTTPGCADRATGCTIPNRGIRSLDRKAPIHMTDTPPPVAPTAGAPLSAAEDKQWASFAHLGGILSFLPPLIIWLVFKDRGRLTDQEGKEALNFQITIAIAQVANFILGIILTVVTFGLWSLLQGLIAFALFVLSLILSIIAFSKVNAGGSYRYPVNIRFIK